MPEIRDMGYGQVEHVSGKPTPTARPNGNLYRPRLPLSAHVMAPEDENPRGVAVLRTHDVEEAKALAVAAVKSCENEIGEGELEEFDPASAPTLEWWIREIGGYAEHDGMPIYYSRHNSGERGMPVTVWRW